MRQGGRFGIPPWVVSAKSGRAGYGNPGTHDFRPRGGEGETMTQLGIALDGAPATLIDERRGPASVAVAGLRQGGRVVGMTMGQFSMLDLLRAVLDITGPAHVRLSTWTAGIRDARNAGLMIDDGAMLSFQLLVDRSFASRQPAYCRAVTRIFGKSAIRCTRTHAKIAIAQNDGWSVVIRSSMNLNRNPRFEQFDIDDSAQLAEFFGAHFDDMSTEMPEGASVRTADVDAVFERLRRGVNPFAVPPLASLEAAGVPVASNEVLAGWVVAQLAAARAARDKSRPRNISAAAKRAGITAREMNQALRATGEPASVLVDVVLALMEDAPSAFTRDEG